MQIRFDNDDPLTVIETYPPDVPVYGAAMRQMFEVKPLYDDNLGW